MQANYKVVVLEEHFEAPELSDGGHGRAGTYTAGVNEVGELLADLGERRIQAMDAAGIDLQILSHTAPAAQNLDPETAVRLARSANDLLHRTVAAKPDRFAGFAILPTPDPAAAVKELERGITELGFVGAMIHGLTHGEFIDA